MKIWGKSKAIHSTWFYLPTYKLLLDCGEGASSTLGIHASDVEHIYISHTHLDHIAGLITMGKFQNRTLKHEPNRVCAKVLYEKSCAGKMNQIKKFLKDFYVSLEFVELEAGVDFHLRKNFYLRPFLVDHSAPYYKHKFPASGCHLIEKRKRLKESLLKEREVLEKKDPKNAHRKFSEMMVKLKEEKGEEAVMEPYDRIMLSYCGDSRPVDPSILKGTEILMHEASFLNDDEMEAAHSHFAEVVAVANKVMPKALIVYHLSERYKRELEDYREEMKKIARKNKLKVPFYIVEIDRYFRIDV